MNIVILVINAVGSADTDSEDDVNGTTLPSNQPPTNTTKLPSTNITNLPDHRGLVDSPKVDNSTNATLNYSNLQKTHFKPGALQRGFLVLIVLCSVIIVYFIIKAVR